MAKILLVEDDQSLLLQLRLFLGSLKHLVDSVSSLACAEDYACVSHYDLIIMDRSLPDGDSIELLGRLRDFGNRVPVLFLTGKSHISEKLEGFAQGADDYLTKPFDLHELESRVNAILRRASQSRRSLLRLGDIVLDCDARALTVRQDSIPLTSIEFSLLELLVRNPEKFFSTNTLLDRIWSIDSESTEEAVKSTVKRLRSKLGSYGVHIKSQRGFGYMFTTNVGVESRQVNNFSDLQSSG